MQVVRTEQIYLHVTDNLHCYCHLSKNLFNEGNYIIRQELNESGKWTRFGQLNSQLNKGVSDNYTQLPSQTANRILYTLDKSWKAFFKAMKDWKIHPEKYLGMPKPPNYKRKDGEHILLFTNQSCKIKDGYLTFPKMCEFEPVKTRLTDDTKLKEVRIIPKSSGFICEIVYNKIIKPLTLTPDNIVGIDLGLRNIITMANNIGEKSIIIKGGAVNSMNYFYNKRKAELQSIYDLQKIKKGSKLIKLTGKRNRKMKDAIHKITRYVVNYCIKNDIGTLVIGYNEGWKQNINLGKRNNQNFVSIPFYQLFNQLEYKCEEAGVNFIKQEESYTSKCSFLDNESCEYHDNYQGKRIKRGIFRSSTGIKINADVNGALNIIKKAIPKSFDKIEGIKDNGLYPVRLTFGDIT